MSSQIEITNLSMVTMYENWLIGWIQRNTENRMQSSIWNIGPLCGFDVDEDMANTIFSHESLKAIGELFRNEGSEELSVFHMPDHK